MKKTENFEFTTVLRFPKFKLPKKLARLSIGERFGILATVILGSSIMSMVIYGLIMSFTDYTPPIWWIATSVGVCCITFIVLAVAAVIITILD